jgi:hypothetical protein
LILAILDLSPKFLALEKGCSKADRSFRSQEKKDSDGKKFVLRTVFSLHETTGIGREKVVRLRVDLNGRGTGSAYDNKGQ